MMGDPEHREPRLALGGRWQDLDEAVDDRHALVFLRILDVVDVADTQAHQVRKLSDLDQQGQEQPAWAALMAKMRRKTLMVCPDCHDGIHKGRQLRATESPESRMR
jgi:hypothetical protein